MNNDIKISSRWPTIDVVEMIANLIAMYSHLFELYNENEVYIKNMQEFWWEEFEEKLDEMPFLEECIDKVYKLRKTAMNVLKDLSPEYNYRYWCLLKHSIASYQYASELWDTDRTNTTYQNLLLDCTQLMYRMLSWYMWVDQATCWRCIADSIEEKIEHLNKNQK